MFLLVAMVSSVSAAQSRIPGSLPTAGTLRALRLEGYDVAGAADGTEALDQLGALPADLIVLDILMPDR